MAKKNANSSPQDASTPTIITGSAGFIGNSLLRRLADNGRPAIALYRAHLPEPRAHIKPVFADLMRRDTLDAVLDHGVKTVVHLAWNQSFQCRLDDAEWHPHQALPPSRNIEMLRNLILAMEQNRVKRLIFLSALGASRHSETLYLQEKYQAESLVLNSKIPEKIILRSTLNFGEIQHHDRLVSAVSSLMRFPWFYPVPKAREKLAPIHVQDMSAIIAKILDLELSEPAQILEVYGHQEIAIDEIFKLVSQGIGKGTHIPLRGVIGQALTPLIERLQRDSRPIGPQLGDLLNLNNKPDQATVINSPLQQALPQCKRKFQEAMLEKKSFAS